MTRAFVRIKRGDKYVSASIETLSNEERREFFRESPTPLLIEWINMLCQHIEILEFESAN